MPRRAGSSYLGLLLLLWWTLATSPPPGSAATVTVVRGPYLQSVTSSSAIVVWATSGPGKGEVRAASSAGTVTSGATTTRFASTVTGMAADYYQHEARLSGLTAGTTYTYDILVDGTDLNSQVDRLTTAPARGTGTATFVAFGDSGTGSTEQRQIASLIGAEQFDLMLHGGDVAYGNSGGTGGSTHQTLHDWFFSIYGNTLRRKPAFPSMGNHDSRAANSNGRPYLDMFVLPTNGGGGAFPDHAERYYSFDYGPLHVVVLDTELAFQDTTRRAAQLAWLEADLGATTQPWKMAVFHRSPFSAGGEHGSDLAVRAAFAPVFEEHGVQAVISAHEHTYERTRPWKVGTDPDGTPVTYIVSGGGGGPLYPAGTGTWTAFSASVHHYVRGTAAECTLEIDAIGLDARVFDTVTLTRCATGPDTDPPSVSISSPRDGAVVRGNVTVTAAATDNVSVARTRLLVDGISIGEDTAGPYAFTWATTSVSNGSHQLVVRAVDAAGNSTDSAPVQVTVDNPTAGPGDIVLYAADATVVRGAWRRQADATAAGGFKMRHPNAGAAKRTTALASPTDYFELTFQAQPNVPYHLWVRSRADGDYWGNDSVFIQFTGANGYAIGTTSATEMNLEDCSGCGLAGWGWQDNGWGGMGPEITFGSTGPHRMRIQTREDGLSIDQIILSPATFLSSSPGALKNDATVYAKSGQGSVDGQAPTTAVTAPASGSTVSGTTTVTATASDNVGVARVEFWVDGSRVGTDTSSPYSFSWNTTGFANGSHTLQSRAYDAAGNVGSSSLVPVNVNNSASGPQEIVLYAADATVIAGAWRREADSVAAGGFRMHHPNQGASKLSAPLANPSHYFELTFTAEANVPYHLWARIRAESNSWANESVFVQFSSGTPYTIGTTSGADINLENCYGCGVSGWGWQDNGWGVQLDGPNITFSSGGVKRLRVQTREDGTYIDQIILSPARHLTTAPGPLKNDSTIYPKTQ